MDKQAFTPETERNQTRRRPRAYRGGRVNACVTKRYEVVICYTNGMRAILDNDTRNEWSKRSDAERHMRAFLEDPTPHPWGLAIDSAYVQAVFHGPIPTAPLMASER